MQIGETKSNSERKYREKSNGHLSHSIVLRELHENAIESKSANPMHIQRTYIAYLVRRIAIPIRIWKALTLVRIVRIVGDRQKFFNSNFLSETHTYSLGYQKAKQKTFPESEPKTITAICK